jgi:transcriptional regulator with XRE-family HTH domain
VSDADEMVELLRYASRAKVATALGVSRTTTGQWARGKDVTPYRLRQVRDLLRPPEPEPPAPAWVERLLAGLMLLEQRENVSADELAAAEARAAIYLAANTRTRPRPRGGGAARAANE